jgi:glycosyltransferase involved in cell wall biosynthesis
MAESHTPPPQVSADFTAESTPDPEALRHEYQERTTEEVETLTRGFSSTPYGGYAYVAEPAPGFDVRGVWHNFHTDSRSGYAAHAVAVSWMIAEELHVPLMLVPHRAKDIDVDRFPADREEMLSRWHSYKHAVGIPELLIVSLPPEMQMAGVAPRMIYYSAYEATKVSRWTADCVNSDQMEAVWCVSDFVRRSFTAGGAKPEKLDVIRPMLCGGAWKLPEVPALAPRDEFVFGTMGTWHHRKGFDHLVRAYFSEFKRTEDVVLNLRTSLFGAGKTIREFTDGVVAEIAEIAREFGDDDFPRSRKMPRIRLQTGTELTDAQVIDWAGTLDGYVAPSFGEGLGIPAIWAKAMGVPLISVDFAALGEMVREVSDASSGQSMDLLVDGTLVQVPSQMQAISPMFTTDAQWADYEPAALGAKMRQLFAAGRRRDQAGARATRAMFGPDTIGPLKAAIAKRSAGALCA